MKKQINEAITTFEKTGYLTDSATISPGAYYLFKTNDEEAEELDQEKSVF